MPTLDVATLEQYWAARRAAAVADPSDVGRVEMAGADALDLLHRLSTQDLRGLRAGQGAGTVLTSEKGRIIDLLTVYHLGERLLLLTSPGNQGAVIQWLERYTITEDSRARDVTGETGLLALLGPRAEALAAAATGQSLASLRPFHHVQSVVGAAPVVLARAAQEPGDGYHVVVLRAGDLPGVKGALLEHGEALGARSIGRAAYHVLRVEAGIPAFGPELGEQYNPLEAQLRPYISFAKGCYIGQEVVARLDTYQKVQKLLAGLLLPPGELPPPGTRLRAAGKDTGFVTSSALSPALGRPIALAYVSARHAGPGTRLSLESGAEAEVAALPFRP